MSNKTTELSSMNSIQVRMELKNAKTEMPPIKMGWSAHDLLVVGKYNYYIGRIRNGAWVDMENKPISDVEWWAELPVPSPHDKVIP